MSPTYRVAIIGHTGHGDYGHLLDRAWAKFPEAQIVGVADADPNGLQQAVKRLAAPRGFADYRQMLDETKPDVVTICPRWIDEHRDMAMAAIERGVRGIYIEKPLCQTLEQADAVVAACEKRRVKLAISFQTRYSPRLHVVWDLIHSGKLGRVLEFRGRGKEDSRGGSEDLWVLGAHVLNLIAYLGGGPQWCMARVLQEGRPIGKADVQPGKEGLGPLAGDEVHALFGLAGGATAMFDSRRNAKANPSRFGLQIFGTEGAIDMGIGHLPYVYYLPDGSWSPGRTGKTWLPVSSEGIGKPEPLPDEGLLPANVLLIRDLLAAIEQDRQPEASVYEARQSTEMILSVFESQRQGRAVAFPLANRHHPLTMLEE